MYSQGDNTDLQSNGKNPANCDRLMHCTESPLRMLVAEALPALSPLLEASSSDRYTLVGGDALIQGSWVLL